MARSNTGGTRGFLRGKIASDLYQVTKDAAGRKIQLVRSVESSRINPNTEAQAVARMQMALCMGSLSQFKALVDHSFETIPYGQLSIAHFVAVNIPLIQEDSRLRWDGNSLFDYPRKGIPGVRIGPFIMSEGSLQLPAAISENIIIDARSRSIFYIATGLSSPTFGQLRAVLGSNAGDYITFVLLMKAWSGFSGNGIVYQRIYLATDIPDETIITPANVQNMFTYDGNSTFSITLDDQGRIAVEVYDIVDSRLRFPTAYCIIISRWDGVRWRRNNSRFQPPAGAAEPWLDNANPDYVFATWFPDYDGEPPIL